MDQQDFTITSVTGCKLYGKVWQGNPSPNAVVILIHGFGEHCSRYTTYFELFKEESIAFVSMDQIGHGRSEGKRGVIQSYKQLLDDVDLLIDKTEALFPDTPKFLYGHSMGGNIAFNYLLQRSFPFKGAIISSPWLQLVNEPKKAKKVIINILKHLCPNLTVKSGLNTKYISTQDKEVINYNDDSHNHGRISFRLLSAISQHGLWVMNNTNQLKVPTLLLHGNKDHVTSHHASKKVAQKRPDLIKYIEFDGMYHEIHNDKARGALANACINWINLELNKR